MGISRSSLSISVFVQADDNQESPALGIARKVLYGKFSAGMGFEPLPGVVALLNELVMRGIPRAVVPPRRGRTSTPSSRWPGCMKIRCHCVR